MATLMNRRKLAAVSREIPKDTRNSQLKNTLNSGIGEEYITQVSEEIERRVTKKVSQKFSRTESRILGVLSKPDEFLLNPQDRTCSVSVPGTSRKNNSENRKLAGDCSLNDPSPEVGVFTCIKRNLSESEEEDPHHHNLMINKNNVEFTYSDNLGFRMTFLCCPVVLR